MQIPIEIVAAAFAAILVLQGWQVRLLYRLASRVRDVETTLEFNGLQLPALRDV